MYFLCESEDLKATCDDEDCKIVEIDPDDPLSQSAHKAAAIIAEPERFLKPEIVEMLQNTRSDAALPGGMSNLWQHAFESFRSLFENYKKPSLKHNASILF